MRQTGRDLILHGILCLAPIHPPPPQHAMIVEEADIDVLTLQSSAGEKALFFQSASCPRLLLDFRSSLGAAWMARLLRQSQTCKRARFAWSGWARGRQCAAESFRCYLSLALRLDRYYLRPTLAAARTFHTAKLVLVDFSQAAGRY